MSEIKIEKGIPMPQARSKAGGIVQSMRQLQVGDSFLAPKGASRASAFTRAALIRIKISTRKEGDTFRLWRIE